MTTTKMNKDKGFTIIEVVLVLAIAALIFLMIFIALPALQRGQANTARKSDIGIIASSVSTYRSNKSGALPADTAALEKYIDKLAQVESTSAVKVIDAASSTGEAPAANSDTIDKVVNVYKKAKCNETNDKAITSASSKHAAVVGVVQVSPNQYDTFCQNV